MNIKVEDGNVILGYETFQLTVEDFTKAQELNLGFNVIENGFLTFSANESIELSTILTTAEIAFVCTTIRWSTSTTNAIVGKKLYSRSEAIAEIEGIRPLSIEEEIDNNSAIISDILLQLP
jgi:hypothetical protein